MLTKEEAILCAECAKHYPKGCGDSFFCTFKIDSTQKAAEMLNSDPLLVDFG
jgi:hypothetical protein